MHLLIAPNQSNPFFQTEKVLLSLFKGAHPEAVVGTSGCPYQLHINTDFKVDIHLISVNEIQLSIKGDQCHF